MALQTTGAISLGDVNVELGNARTTQINMGGTTVRNLFKRETAGSAVSLASHGRGKSNVAIPDGDMAWTEPSGFNTQNPNLNSMTAWEYGGKGINEHFYYNPSTGTVHLMAGVHSETAGGYSAGTGTSSTGGGSNGIARRGSTNSYGQPSMLSYYGYYANPVLLEISGGALVPKTITVSGGGFSSVNATVYTDRVVVGGVTWDFDITANPDSMFTSTSTSVKNFGFETGLVPTT